ncbi:MAG: hypothetical protein K0R27_5515, partial [Xanthobacteraceae bacterium]|nr:hypothetical protein [Xanthobacteraceae bacterium]
PATVLATVHAARPDPHSTPRPPMAAE